MQALNRSQARRTTSPYRRGARGPHAKRGANGHALAFTLSLSSARAGRDAIESRRFEFGLLNSGAAHFAC